MTKLSGSERDAIAIIIQHPGITAKDIAPLIFVTANAAGAMLTRMTKAGMVSRRKIGRSYRYTRATIERRSDE